MEDEEEKEEEEESTQFVACQVVAGAKRRAQKSTARMNNPIQIRRQSVAGATNIPSKGWPACCAVWPLPTVDEEGQSSVCPTGERQRAEPLLFQRPSAMPASDKGRCDGKIGSKAFVTPHADACVALVHYSLTPLRTPFRP